MSKKIFIKRICVVSLLVVVVGLGDFSVSAQEKSSVKKGVRAIEAVRVGVAPVIDGKLDDVCWQKTQPVMDFLSIDSERLASYQSIGYVCYDDSHLYIGMKCLLPKGVTPAVEQGRSKEKMPHDTYIFSDDIVEIMIDPGRSLSNYYQLVVNAYGTTYDTYRKGGGAQHDPTWNGDWIADSYISDDYWSIEMSVPFHNLGITPEMGSTWGINICRERKRPADENSSISAMGTFHNMDNFAVLKGLNVDFKKYLFQIGPADIRFEQTGDNPQALFSVPVKNMTGRTREVKIERWDTEGDKKEAIESRVVTLQPGEESLFSAETLEVEPLSSNRTDAYIVSSVAKTKKVIVSDAKDGTILSLSYLSKPWYLEVIRVEVEDPWKRDMLEGKTKAVSLKVNTLLSKEQTKKGELLVRLTSKDSGKVLASKSFSNPTDTTEVTFSTEDIPWGVYEVEALFKETGGKEIVSTHGLATVLPGGKQQIKVLNNLVSELMNAEERDMLGEKEIEFMNPRDGWVFFSISGAGKATLDPETKPLVVGWGLDSPATEVMRRLAPGRHVLRLEGEFDHIVIRAVPELIYSCHPSSYPWEFLRKDVLPNCNVILGSGHDEEALRQWTTAGKRWIGFSVAPGHGLGGEVFLNAKQYYEERLSKDGGFAEPLFSGVMVDQIAACSPAQKVEIAKMLSWIAENPELKGKEFRPWFEGTVFGSDAERSLMRIVLDAGWPFSFYEYITEKDTEEQARIEIQNRIVNKVLSCEKEMHGSLRRAIVTFGYFSSLSLGSSLNFDPGVDFKILMQMQFETLANDPHLFGIYGALWYYSPYVDEEYLQWGGRLFRHYGIEGKTTKLTNDPYQLTHIKNPDFEEETKGWVVTEAEPGSVNVKSHIGYGNLQGRFIGGSKGDTFLLTRRSAKGANKFSQEIKGLTPGRVYSMKMITADYRNIMEEKSVKQQEAVSVKLENVEIVTGHGKNILTCPNNYGHPLGKFTGSRNYPGPGVQPNEYCAYMNHHLYMFRAKGNTAKLTVSDWAKPDSPGGPIGQEIMYNFIEIQPYLEN